MLAVMSKAAEKNQFKIVSSSDNGVISSSQRKLTISQQMKLVAHISEIQPPFVFHGHFHFVDFSKYGSTTPIYINLIRDPIDRFVSAYYFTRFGDGRNRTWGFKGTKSDKFRTLDECVLSNYSECTNSNKLLYTIPYFCGQTRGCRGSSYTSLRRAINNVVNNYLAVGVLEDVNSFIKVLERLLPAFFKEAYMEAVKIATASDVRQAYLQLARRYHPDTSDCPDTAEKFKEISKAYGVLNDPIQRARYDCSLDIKQFERIFKGSSSIFSDQMCVDHCGVKMTRQDPPISYDLFVSLEEINTGIVKKLKINRKIVLNSGESRSEEKVLIINVMPGWKEGITVTFAREGDRKPDVIPADIIITIRQKEHKYFTRDSDNNLIYNCKISLKDALVGNATDIPTLDGRTLRIQHDGIIQPGTQTIFGEGLPLPNNPHNRGNLIVNYNIIFPQHLSSEQKQVICDSLPKY
ncbi:DnaJ-like subfamily B member 4 [Exaiptasia diaphana]|nr:DnaJ-like subfamily B member 4 [Exaiptasia diaphana]